MDRPEGGVAILIHKSLQFSPLSLPHLETIEVVGVSIALRNNRNKLIDILSVYIPNGNSCSEEELTSLTTGRNNFIIGGDFNGHHGRWETSCNLPNQSGRALASILENTTNIELATPTNLGTRLNLTTLTYSTIDLTLMAPHLAISSEITRGPHLSSDHIPLHIKVQADPTLSIERAPTWNLKDADWTTWNKEINIIITSSVFYCSESSGLHNRIKANLARLNNKIDSTCSYCEEVETTKHILLKCPGLETEREKIRLYFTAHNIEINLRNLLGLNQKFNSNTQHDIQRLLTKFLKKAKLINRI